MAIPITKARIQRSISLYVLPNVDEDTMLGGVDAIASAMSAAVKVGSAKKISITESITSAEWRELDAEQNGEIVEIVPGVATYQLIIDKVELYTEKPAYPFIGTDILLNQLKPFIIQIEERKPSSAASTYTVFTGCIVTNNPVSYDIASADPVVRSLTVQAARKYNY